MTYCSQTSLDSRLSDRNTPFGSEKSVLSAQKSASDSSAGRPTGIGAGGGGGAGADWTAGGVAGVGGCDAGGACRAHDAGVSPTASTSHAVPAKRHCFDKLS